MYKIKPLIAIILLLIIFNKTYAYTPKNNEDVQYPAEQSYDNNDEFVVVDASVEDHSLPVIINNQLITRYHIKYNVSKELCIQNENAHQGERIVVIHNKYKRKITNQMVKLKYRKDNPGVYELLSELEEVNLPIKEQFFWFLTSIVSNPRYCTR